MPLKIPTKYMTISRNRDGQILKSNIKSFTKYNFASLFFGLTILTHSFVETTYEEYPVGLGPIATELK